jgi:hypothetical protein
MHVESALAVEVSVATVAVGHCFKVRFSDKARKLGIWKVEFKI